MKKEIYNKYSIAKSTIKKLPLGGLGGFSLLRGMGLRGLFLLLFISFTSLSHAQEHKQKKIDGKNLTIKVLGRTDSAFFNTDEARRVGDQVLLFQRVTGGWQKNADMVSPLSDEDREKVLRKKKKTDDSTIDNRATTMQMKFLARLYYATKDDRYREGFNKGLEFLLSGQYENGGWPQFWPNPQGYQVHITYNDDTMANTLNLFLAIIKKEKPVDERLVDETMRERLQKSLDKGVECILNTQIRHKKKLTIWCQQHDKDTFAPASARAFELASYCPSESAGIVMFLMNLPNPSDRVKKSVNSAMAWFDKYKLTGLKFIRTSKKDRYNLDAYLVSDSTAKPIWARYYDLEYCEPFVCDRDGILRRSLQEIGVERRTGYIWYNDLPAELYRRYDRWADKYDPKHKVRISLKTKGANETGLVKMNRKIGHKPKEYDAVVKAGQSIQEAIEKAPEKPTAPYKIYVRNGVYNQKVIIDRPNIVLVGESKDSTILRFAETDKYLQVGEYKGKKIHHGVVVLLPKADSCVISGFTIYNNYGSTVEKGSRVHQMSVYGQASHTIIINCNIYSDGNDALSLWGKMGMYYHADLNLRVTGVDFMCPRGWCYATRCKFYGSGSAMIWHDGSKAKEMKLMITNSFFDGEKPTKLGRWHHNSQFFLVDCRLSKNVKDEDISYAYKDKVLDPCEWGKRVYYRNCYREGGDSGWLRNNERESEDAANGLHSTAEWCFGYKWDPEAHIRNLWKWLAY